MNQDVHEVEAPRHKAEKIIAQHEADVHEGSVIIGVGSLKCPDTCRKYVRYESYLPDPGILHYLRDVIIDKSIEKCVGKNTKDNYYDNNYETGRCCFSFQPRKSAFFLKPDGCS